MAGRGVRGGAHAWPGGHVWPGRGVCMVGGMHGQGRAWQGGMHGQGHVRGCMVKGGMHSERGACVVKGGHAWQRGGVHGEGGACVVKGGMRGERGEACVVCMPPMRYGRSMRGRYASYWNAFLLNGQNGCLRTYL